MRLFALAAAAVLTGMCSSAANDPMSHEVVASGSQARANGAYRAVVFSDENAYRTQWRDLVPEREAPPVDFSKWTAILLMADTRPSGGFTISVQSVNVAGESFDVRATVNPPPADAFVTAVLTVPWTLIVVPKSEIDNARWSRM